MAMQDSFSRMWFEYFMRTPFFSTSTLADCHHGTNELLKIVRQSFYEKLSLWQKFSQSTSNRSRGFFLYPNNAEDIVKFFGYTEQDPIINAAGRNSLQLLLENLRTRKVILIAVDEDFFNAVNMINDSSSIYSADFLLRYI